MADTRILAALACAVTALSACTPAAGNDPSSSVAFLPYASVWSADPGTDLSDRGVELIRAAVEAGTYSATVGVDDSFPGFRDAVTLTWPPRTMNPRIDGNMRSEKGYPGALPRLTYFRHVTDYESTADSARGVVCQYTVLPEALPATGDAKPLSVAWTVELALAGDSGVASTPDPDTGTDPRSKAIPTWTTFGDWKIRELNKVDPPSACADWWLERFPDFTRRPGTNVLYPPEGYVYPTAPVGVQYPEWIPPGG